MTNRKNTRRALLMSALSLLLCFSMLIGTTFAWFTDSVTSANNIITAGNLDVDVVTTADGKSIQDQPVLFDGILWEPGVVAYENITVKNLGTLALKYQLAINFENGNKIVLADGTITDYSLDKVLKVAIVDGSVSGTREEVLASAGEGVLMSELVEEGALLPSKDKNITIPNAPENTPEGSKNYGIVIWWEPSAKDNDWNIQNGKTTDDGEPLHINLGLKLVATQLAAENDSFGNDYDENVPQLADKWDGTVDTSWYNETDTEFTLTTAEQFAGLALLTGTTDQFEGKIINLGVSVDLDDKSFAPIGTTGERDSRNRLITEPFKGTFDGNGNSISNISQSGWDFGYEWGQYGSIGLFSELESATVKNVTISGYDAAIEGGDIAAICGSATGTCVFENITIEKSQYGTYNNGIGGIIGWSGAGTYTFKNITIAEDVMFGGLWGSFDSSVGGIVGQGEPGATYNFENVNVACRLDVFNDVTAAYKYYQYRMSGMLIGRLDETTTIDGSNYPDMSKYNITCKDVTVTYGDWMNYHYCVVAGKTAWRHEAGYSYGGVPADHDHSTCAMHCNLLLPFDGLFGGAQYGVRPITEYEGVTVKYPASYNPEG